MKKVVFLLCCFFSIMSLSLPAENKWTWLYQKKFSAQEQIKNKNKDEILFSKSMVPLFSQLIFSWNAFRPQEGFYRFWTQVRDAKTKRWGPWHKMIDWGNGISRSYESSSRGSSSKYVYVRLEAEPNKADGFRIKITAQKGANLSLLHAFAISTSDFKKFSSEIKDRSLRSLPSVYVAGVPKKSQFLVDHEDNFQMCSPTSCSMVTSYLLNEEVNTLDFALHAYDDGLGMYGCWPFNVAHAYERCEGAALFSTARLNSFKELHECLDKKIPVVVSVRGYLKGGAKVYNNGHLVVVVGWDAKKQHVICHDPAFKQKKKVVTRYSLPCFLNAWERSRRLVYLAEPMRQF